MKIIHYGAVLVLRGLVFGAGLIGGDVNSSEFRVPSSE